ncbi:hypothetical protein B0T16DRAFT_459588 [Cercophora newfieldiana]|uniref:Uncharacterized protein n=1 Tax=Cercophora newfieldiana TaxID=92897 RepID=A0AA40CNG9_9PEZI|nr:hypothetical protein B0T16DRAFT_459588 [Cercophora newfieldiana]
MDALKHVVANVPDWLKRLEELNSQVEKRQKELAQLAEPHSSSDSTAVPSVTKSLRNKGSQESLRPHDEPEAHPRESTPQPEVAPIITTDAPAAALPAPSSPAEPQSPSAVARQLSQARAAGQARARATLRRHQRSDSVISAEGAAPKYRSRSMIIVYYDSYVQLFFEDLVKFVSASRNMMRKAKMAAKVAQIKRLAELEMPDESEEEEAEPSTPSPADGAIVPLEAAPTVTKDGDADEKIPSLRYMSTRRMQSPGLLMAQAALGRSMYSRAGIGARGPYGRGAMGPPGLDPLEKDIYDDLDKGLEFVQSMCEHAAHQFLRDGDCAEEVGKISSRMAETQELAGKELERVQREEPDTLKAAEDESRGRSYRPPSMRKDLTSSCSHRSDPSIKDAALAAAKASAAAAAVPSKLAVDEGVEDMQTDATPNPALNKATRMM